MKHTPTYRRVDVTPDIAEKWLTDNTHNRNLNERLVEVFAGAMLRGEWRENGDAIRFSKPPRVLLDGQKRLTAVVRSGVTVPFLVAENLDHEAQITMDTGQKRSFADTLKLQGETDTMALAAFINKIYLWQTGQIRSHNKPATFDQLLSLYEQIGPETIAESAKVGQALRRHLPIAGATGALAHYLFHQIDADDCEFFFGRLRDGQALSEGDPIFALRKTLLNSLSQPRGRYSDVTTLAFMIKAWNAYRNSESLKIMSWKVGGAKPEAFPVPV